MRGPNIILAALVLALQACTTTYVGHKLPPDGSQPTGDTGVPYTLTRHDFTLKVAPDPADATKPVYTLTRTSVPDPNQRYSLALSPGFLTDGTMTYNFGALGNLGNAEASTTSQVVATTKAVAGFAANVIGAKTALKDEADVWTRFRGKLETPIACKNGSGAALVAYEGELDALAKKKFPDPDKDATDKVKAESAMLNKRAAFVADRFHYRTAAEKDCLAAVKLAFDADELETEKGAYNAAILAAEGVAANSQAVNDLKDLVSKKRGPDTVAAKLSALDDKADSKLKAAYEKAQAYLTGVQSNKLAAKLATFYVDMPLDVWRARHLVQVESDLDKARFASQVLLANPPGKGASNDDKKKYGEAVQEARRQVKLQEEQRDQLVDAVDLQRRIAAIDVLLNASNTGDGEGRTRLSADRDRLQGLWDQARADLLIKNQTFDLANKAKAPKIEAKEDVPVVLVDECYVTGVNERGKAADATRKFVVVMRRLPSSTPMQGDAPKPTACK
jgi:hypothetical protein